MSNHKFEYVISGVELSETQKTAINAAIASAVSGVLIGAGSRQGGIRDLVEGEVVGSPSGGVAPISAVALNGLSLARLWWVAGGMLSPVTQAQVTPVAMGL